MKKKTYFSKVLVLLFSLIMVLTLSVSVNAATKKKVSIKASNQTITVGTKNKSLGVKVTKGAKVTYKSSAPSTVSVTSSGKITAKKAGTAKITIKASKKGYTTAKKVITVKAVKKNQKITASNKSVYVGSTKAIGAKAKTTLSYKSSNTSVVTVNSKGTLTGKKSGTATVTITAKATGTYNKATKKITVKVVKRKNSITAKNVSVYVGKTKSIGAKATYGTLSYKSSNTKVATVSSKGVVKGIKEGKATITITAKGNSKYATGTKKITVTVTKKLASQTITASNLTLYAGETGNVKATAKTALTYASSDKSIATVDNKGNVKALKAGKVTIKITAAKSSTYNAATKEVTVTIKKASLRIETFAEQVEVGKTIKLNVIVWGNAPLTYESTDPSIATVDENGVVTGIKEGEVTIKVTAAETEVYESAEATSTVTVLPEPTQKWQTIFFPSAPMELKVGETGNVGATAKTTLTYESSDPSVATVDADGNVTALKEGSAIINIMAEETEEYLENYDTRQVVVLPAATPVDPTPTPTEPEVTEVSRDTIHHDATGHTETIVIKEAWTEEKPIFEERPVMDGYFCNTCNEEMSYPHEHFDRDTAKVDALEDQAIEAYKAGNMEEYERLSALAEEALNNIHDGWHGSIVGTEQVQVGTETITHPAETEEKWVVDTPAYDEVVITYSDGSTKTETTTCIH